MQGGNPQAGYSGMNNQIPSSQFSGQPMQPMQPMQQPQMAPAQFVPIASNQLVDDPKKYRLSPVVTKCPHCFQTVTTNVETKCSCGACCVCCMTLLVVYLCIQCCRDKDFCCQDAVHKCPSCQKDIFFYKAM